MDENTYDWSEVRDNEYVKRCEQEILEASQGRIEYVFTKEGSSALAKLASARVSAHLKLIKSQKK